MWIAGIAVLYAILLIPFNQASLVIGGISIRPAAALPVVLGIFFGTAAAWGLGIGNIAGDNFGSWSLLSIFGFLINFIYPYISYLLWHRLVKRLGIGRGSIPSWGTGFWPSWPPSSAWRSSRWQGPSFSAGPR
jgi:hypothetical protein